MIEKSRPGFVLLLQVGSLTLAPVFSDPLMDIIQTRPWRWILAGIVTPSAPGVVNLGDMLRELVTLCETNGFLFAVSKE